MHNGPHFACACLLLSWGCGDDGPRSRVDGGGRAEGGAPVCQREYEPLSELAVGLDSITLQRGDARQIVDHVAATSGEDNQIWAVGGLCHDRCEGRPVYACAFDFDAYWQVAAPDE